MRKLIQYRWILLTIWVASTLLFLFHQPDIQHILGKKGEVTVQDNAPSKVASDMLRQMNTANGDSLILVFHDKNKISDAGMKDIETGLTALNAKKQKLGITEIIDPFGTPEVKDQLISKDQTTLMVQVSYNQGDRTRNEVVTDFENAIKSISVTHYITGEAAISSDYMKTVSTGVEKSGIITIIFILIVLILMFRSAITPFVSLLAVGIAYICSMGIIGFMIKAFNFPITNFTQMFIILVLFGIGTDYHILLLNRFNEELSNGLSVDDAIVVSLRTAGKTILYSGLTVFIGFLSLSFVQFPIYRSANAVAVGIAVLLLEILTLTPVFMKLLAGKLFWPSKTTAGHKESGFWGRITTLSVKRPILSLLLIACIIGPIIFFNTTKLSFDSMADLDSNTPSIKGFHLIAENFGNGKAMPVTLVIRSDKPMDNNESLAALDHLTKTLQAVKGIDTVAGPTQPKGEPIKDFYTGNQLNTASKGLSQANDGISKISSGLNKIDQSLTVPDFSKVNDLVKGTGDIANGMSAITNGLEAIDNGISQGADGAAALKSGIHQLKTGISTLNTGLSKISKNLTTVSNGYTALGKGYTTIGTSLTQLKLLQLGINYSISNISKKLPGDPDVAALKSSFSQLSSALDSLANGMSQANSNYDTLTSGLGQLDAGLKQVVSSTSPNSKLVKGIDKLEAGAQALSEGLKKGSNGQQEIIKNMKKLKDGSTQVHEGVTLLNENLNSLGDGMGQLKDGISASKNGLDTIHSGINKGTDFLTELSSTKTFYIPEEAFGRKEIDKMFDAYMSKDRKMAKLTIALDSEPYADASVKLIDHLKTVTENQLKSTVLSNSEFGIAGPTALSRDMSNMATHDIVFTQCIVLLAIFILLVIITKSFWIPVYIVGSLIAAYYTALSATAFLSNILFHNPNGMAWNVPFFSFVMIAALGVDYSIFLMERFREYPELSAKDAIVLASRNIGGVVMSAAIILSGTFATLYPSNLVVLMELAICVIIGLMLLSTVLLPVVIPALITLQQKLTTKEI